MLEVIKEAVSLFNPDHCKLSCDTPVTFTENTASGKGTISIKTRGHCLAVLTPGSGTVISWLRNQKRAEGFFFEIGDSSVKLHIVELKSDLSASCWSYVKNQAEAAYLHARSILSLLDIKDISAVFLHVGYKRDMSDPMNAGALSLLKPIPAKGYIWKDWFEGEFVMYKTCKVKISKHVRDTDGNASGEI